MPPLLTNACFPLPPWVHSRLLPSCSNGMALLSREGSYRFCLLLLQIVTRTTPVKRGLLHDPRVPEDCPADVRTLIADCTKLIAADRPDTKV